MSITNLPDELLLHICVFLSPKDIFNMATIYPVWERISHKKIPVSKFRNVTLDNQEMSLSWIKAFVEFINEHSPFVSNLTCSNFSTTDLLDIISSIEVMSLGVAKLTLEGTKLDLLIFREKKPNFNICIYLEIKVTEYPDVAILSQLSRSKRSGIKIIVLTANDEVVKYWNCGALSFPSKNNQRQKQCKLYMWMVSTGRYVKECFDEEYSDIVNGGRFQDYICLA